MPPKAAGVAGQWERAWDTKNKRWYYQDRVTGESSWVKPLGVDFEISPDDPPPADEQDAVRAPETCPHGWEAAWDPKLRRHYYFCRQTGERVWTFKKSAAKATAPTAAADAPAAAAGPASSSSQPAGVRTRGAGRANMSDWNHEGFLRRLTQAKETRDQRTIKRVLVDVSESNYQLRDTWRPLPRTSMFAHADVLRRQASLRIGTQQPEVTFSGMTTADAIEYFTRQGRQVCALNFANGASVGGGYKNGAIAQEEDLCRRCPTLYTSLNNAKRDGHYPFGPPTCRHRDRPERYSTVLFTPDVVLARGHEETGFEMWPASDQVRCSILTAAAPFYKQGEVYDLELMYCSVQSMFIVPRIANERGGPQADTLILGAWGCGVFGCNPQEVSDLFARAIGQERLGSLYTHIHFAIPQFSDRDTNNPVFYQVLRDRGINVQPLP